MLSSLYLTGRARAMIRSENSPLWSPNFRCFQNPRMRYQCMEAQVTATPKLTPFTMGEVETLIGFSDGNQITDPQLIGAKPPTKIHRLS